MISVIFENAREDSMLYPLLKKNNNKFVTSRFRKMLEH